MSGAGHVHWGECKVNSRENGPDRSKDEEVHLGGGYHGTVGVVPVGH